MDLQQAMAILYQFIICCMIIVLEPYRGKVGLYSTFFFTEVTNNSPGMCLLILIEEGLAIYNSEAKGPQVAPQKCQFS